MTKKTELYKIHEALSAKLIPFAGFEMPVRYFGDKAEHINVRNNVGVFDISHMGEFLVKGDKALELIQKITTNDASKLVNGKAQYSCMPNLKGGIIDDLIVYRLEVQLYMLVVNAANIEKDWNWLVKNNKEIGAELEDISEKSSLIAVSGPKSDDVLAKLTDMDIRSLQNYEFVKGKVLDFDNVLIATTGYTGERTFEIFIRNQHAVELWEAIFEAGKEFDIQPAGLGARDTLRLEMGYMLYGNDINDKTSPIEAGLSWITKLKKGDFNSSEIFKKQKADGVEKKLVAFEMIERGIPRQHYKIAKNGEEIGEVTSGTMSPMLNKGIGMAYVKTSESAIDNEIDIVIRNKNVKAKIVKAPFYKK